MATLNGKYRVKNSKNGYDTVHLETSASQVKFDDGKTFQQKLNEGVLTGPKGDTGAQGPTGPKGDKGNDGLTTSITIGSTKYAHLNGNITIPSYPSTPQSVGAEPANNNIQAHISSAHAPSNAQKNSDITKAEIEAKLTGTISTHTHNYETASGAQQKADTALASAKDYADTELAKKANVSHGTHVIYGGNGTATTVSRSDHSHTAQSVGAEPANSNIQAHISSAHAPSNAQKNSDITKAEIEAKLTGTISTHTHANSTTTSNGLMSSTDKVKLDSIETGANKYIHPTSHTASMIIQSATHRFVTDTEKSTWDAKETTSGSQAKADKAKADAISSSNAYTDTKVAGLVNSAPETLDTLKELSTALGNDPNFATTVANQIGTKADTTYVNTELAKKANSSHGTHVTYSTTTPLPNGTATAGTSANVSRGDHVHPLQTSVSGNAGTATKLATARSINGTNFDGSGNITTANWGAARTLTIGKTGKSVNGSADISWSLSEIGAAATSHAHTLSDLPLESITSSDIEAIFSAGGEINKNEFATDSDIDAIFGK